MEKTKNQLRREAKLLRDSIPSYERKKNSARICQRILSSPWYQSADTILVYSAIQSEVSLDDLIVSAGKAHKRIYFPRVEGEDMNFYAVTDLSRLTEGSFHVMEPEIGEPFPPEGVGPVIVPAVAFSKAKQRLGYGKGYYDRYLSRHPGLYPIGVCFEEQIVDTIPADCHDQPMEMVITQENIYR